MNELFAQVFELFGLAYQGQLSEDLYDNNIYTTIGLITIALALLAALFYYIILDRPKGVNWSTWLLYGIVAVVLLLIVNSLYLGARFDNIPLDYYIEDYLGFLLVTGIWGLLFYFVFSMIIKSFSVNRRRSPF